MQSINAKKIEIAPKEVVDYAKSMVLLKPNLNILRAEQKDNSPEIAHILQEKFLQSDARGKLVLPNMRAHGNETVAVFSDYSGESSGNYFTYSFLVCAWNLTGNFFEQMKQARRNSGLSDKEIAFKDFGLEPVRNVLPEYLRHLDNLVPGFLFTLVVDKKISCLFGKNHRKTLIDNANDLRDYDLGLWKPDVAEKLLRVVHVGAFLTGLLAHHGQKIFWMSDNDAICANEKLHVNALNLFSRVLANYSRPESGFSLIGGAAPFKQRDIKTLDLLSIADVTSSSIAHYLSRKDASSSNDFGVKGGSEQVLQWLAHDGVGLKKMVVTLRPAEDGQIYASSLEFNLQTPVESAIVIPIAT